MLAKSTKNNSVSIKHYCKLEFQQARGFQSWIQAQYIPPLRSGLPFSLTGGKRYEQKGISPATRRHKFPDIKWSCLRPDHCLSHIPQPHWAARERKENEFSEVLTELTLCSPSEIFSLSKSWVTPQGFCLPLNGNALVTFCVLLGKSNTQACLRILYLKIQKTVPSH